MVELAHTIGDSLKQTDNTAVLEQFRHIYLSIQQATPPSHNLFSKTGSWNESNECKKDMYKQILNSTQKVKQCIAPG